MKVIVTGGAGFIGSHVVDALLLEGHEVTVVDNLVTGDLKNLNVAREMANKNKKSFRIVEKSVCDKSTWDSLESCDAIFHFAAQTSVTASVSDPDNDFKVNVLSTQLVCDWVRRNGIRFVLYSNTAGALYGNANEFPTTEQHLCHPESPYGATKLFFESYYSALSKSLKANQTWSSHPSLKNYNTWASLRLSNVYGPRQVSKGEAGVIPIFVESFEKLQGPNIFGDGNKTRDYVHVSDVVLAFMEMFKKMQQVPVDDYFNVATSCETTDLGVFETVLKAVVEGSPENCLSQQSKKALLQVNPRFASVRPGEVIRSAISFHKIQNAMGWRPRIDFYEGVKSTVKYILNQ
jgi:UDP-glucose 4-epimerase